MGFSGITLRAKSGEDLEPYFAQMTNGANVQLLLERGGTWSGDYIYRQAGGGPTNTHVIKADKGSGALPVFTGQLQIGIAATPISRLTLKELEFQGPGPLCAGSGDVLGLRQLYVHGGDQGIIVQADTGLTWKHVTIHLCRIMDLSNTSGEHVQGIYCARVAGLNITENVIDNAVAPKDIFSHHIYIQNGCTGVRVEKNILSRSSSHALQLRPGGLAQYNLVIDCPIGILGGGGTDPEVNGVSVQIYDNATLGGGDIGPGYPRGWAYYLENIAVGSVHNNLALDGVGGDKRGLTKDCSATGVEGDPEVGVLYVNGANYHKNHGTVHTDAGFSTGTVMSWNQVPNPAANTSFTALGLTWDAIRAGKVSPVLIIKKMKQLVGLSP